MLFRSPWWVQIIKALAIFAVIFAVLPVLIVYERKLLGRFQGRYGPNRVGPFGLMQPLAEIVKFATKEPMRPTTAQPYLFRIAPMIAIVTGEGGSALGRLVGVLNIDAGILEAIVAHARSRSAQKRSMPRS